MAKIVGVNNQYIKVQMKNGTSEVYSRDCIDWEPQVGQELGFMIDEEGNVFIDLKENIPEGTEYIPESEKEIERPAFSDTYTPEEEKSTRKKKVKKEKPVEDEFDEDDEDDDDFDDYEGDGSLVAIILGLILGVAAMVLTFLFPSLKIVAIIAGVLAVVLGIVGFFKGNKKVFSIIAMVLGVFAVVLSLLMHGDGKTITAPTPTPEITETPEVAPTPTPEATAYETVNSNLGVYQNYAGVYMLDAVIEIKNTGTQPMELGSGSINVIDADGNALGSDSNLTLCPKVLQPGETGYVQSLSGGVALDDYHDVSELRAELDLTPEEKGETTVFTIGEGSYSVDGYGYPYITGNIINNTEVDATNVTVQCMFFDNDGNPAGVTEAVIDSLPAGQTVGFEVYGSDLPASLLGNGLARYDVYAMQ